MPAESSIIPPSIADHHDYHSQPVSKNNTILWKTFRSSTKTFKHPSSSFLCFEWSHVIVLYGQKPQSSKPDGCHGSFSGYCDGHTNRISGHIESASNSHPYPGSSQCAPKSWHFGPKPVSHPAQRQQVRHKKTPEGEAVGVGVVELELVRVGVPESCKVRDVYAEHQQQLWLLF